MAASSGGRLTGGLMTSLSPPEEIADGAEDGFLVLDLGGDDFLLAGECLLEIRDELARPVGTLDLAVAEQVRSGQQVSPEDLDALLGIPLGPVVPVREVEEVSVPEVGWELAVDQVVTELVGGGDHRAPAL